jgi:hypothetical protein
MRKIQADVLAAIRLITLGVEGLERDLGLCHQLVTVPTVAQPIARMLDLNALDPVARRLVDEGDLPPEWIYWWLSLAAALSCQMFWDEAASLIVYTDRRHASDSLFPLLARKISPPYQVLPLMVTDLCEAFNGNADSAGFAIAWGVTDCDYNRPVFPLACRGAIVSILDKLGVACLINAEDRIALRPWMGDVGENSEA